MSCVNKSSKEFKALAANNGISANTLELITHKYWLETGSEKNFPTDVYIQAQLGNSQYKEDIPEVRKLWDNRYKYPRQYSSYEEVRRAYEEAAKVFPLSSIVYYKNSNGNYALSVKQPVEKVYDTASDFFNQDLSSAKKLDLGIDNGRTYGIDKVQELYNRFNNDRTSKYLADKVFKIAKDLGITVSFNEELPFGKTGRYKNDNSIVYKKSFLERDAMTGLKALVLLHEVIHAISMYALSKNTKNWSRSKDLEKFRTEVNDIFSKVRYNDALKGERGKHDVYEFVAELANPIFRQKLQSIDNRSWWTKLVDAVKNLLGIHTSSTYYNRSMRALNNALEAFDLDSYLRYNGLKSPLQQAYNEHRVDYENMPEDELKSMLKDTIKETDTSLDNKDINKTVNDYINGKEQFNNLTEEENDIARRDKLLAGGEVAARIHGSSNREESQDERNERQEKQVEDWAKEAGVWHEDALSYGKSFGNEVQGGQESHVYVNERNKSIIKVKATTQYHDLQEFLDGIILHNTIFPETAYKVLGFGNDGEGFVAILEQPFIVGEEPTQEQITEYVKSKVPDAEMYEEELGNGRYKTSQTLLHDLSPRNAIITPNGNIAIIDDIIRPNIASEEKGGTRSDDYSLSPTNQELLSLIDSMTKEQLVSELNHIKQEYADYDLVATDDEDSSNDKIKDKSFTFNDGITVPTPFRLNNQQADALNVMNDFIHSDDTTMTLSGYAGTGKTSLMEIMAQKARRDGKLIMFCATTNKAAAVLKSKVSRQGFDAQTLNKLFGINVEVDTNKAYDAKNLVNKLKEAQIPYGTTVIIDEASMINEENYKILNQVARENGLKIIYVGDRAQLAPVGEDKVSKVFRNTDGKVVELTKVERTDDNAILKEATNVRNGKPLSGISSFNDKGEGVAFINPKGEHRQAIVDVIKHYVQGLKKDPNYFRILAYTNKAVSQYNNYVRKLLGYNDNTPRVGEPIIGYANWGYHWQTKTYDFINSESYKVTKVEQPTIKSIQVGDKDVRMNVTPITLENSLGEKHTFDFMDIKGNAANREAATLLAIMKAKLWERARRASKAEKRDIYAQINAIDSFLFVNDNITDAQGHYLQSKTFDYGYALTVHKSQGSTFTNVLLDENDISKARNNDASNALASVDLGEDTSNNPETSTLESSEDVDLGFDFGDSKTEEQQDNDVANMKQQLDYVGISRATDTVTVVSDNAKKEDSPLNHLKGKKEEETPANQQTINNEENRSNNVEIYHGNWSRSDVEKQTDKVFLFGDNTNDRVNTHHVPTMTQAVIRGLPNAIGIDTKKDRGTSESSYFTDADFDTFKKQVDEAIQKAIDSGKTIVIPEGGIGTGKAMLDRKAPKLYKYLQEQLDKLKNNTNDIQSRGLVQAVSTGNFKINWQSEGSRGGSENTQEGERGQQNSNNTVSQGSSRPLADVAKQISLPGYEYFNDFQENTKVDASWKIPLLRDLDSQLSNENTAEQNQEIINKMNDILKANVEEDIKENSSKKEERIQKNLNEYEKLNKEFDNLLEGQFDTNGEYAQGEETNLKDFDVKFTAEEINHLSELIGNYMSDMITRLQTEKGLASQLFPELKFKDGTDFTNMSRKEIVDTIGVNNLVNRAKYDFDPQNNVIDFDNEDVILKAALALENWDALMLKASTTFSFNEGYGIRRDYDKGGFDTAEEHSQIAYDDFNDYQDEDSVEEQYGDSQEQWQIDQRTVDVMNSMSELVRQGLHECYELDSNNNKVIDKNWKLPLRVNPRKATNSILRWVKGSLTLQDMINKLQEKQGSNPWLSQLIERLSDTSGKETDFQSQFFGVFSKPFQLYNIILVDGKKYTSITVNSHPALTEAMNTITTQYKIGEHPLFNVDGRINSKLLGSEKAVADSNDFNLHQALSNMQTIADGINHGEKVDSELIKEASKWLTGVSRLLGYDVTEDMVADVLNGDTIKDMTKYLNFIVRDLDSAYKAQSNNPKKTYQPFVYGADNNIGGALRNFLKPITDSLEDTAISAFYDSGKMYQSYVTPSFMTKLMAKFKSLKGQDFTDFIMKEYGNSEWFRKPMTRLEMRTNGGWRNDMLRLLATTEEARNVFDFHVELNFNKHNYMRNMTDSEYTLSLITEYFSDGWQTNKTDTSWYRMPMESNKPSSEFFRFYSYRGTHYKDTITNSLYKMFLQELSRIQTVKMRNLSKSDDAFIKNFDTNGRKFNFLPFLNSYLDNSKEAKADRTLLRNADGTVSKDNDYLAELIQRKSDGLEENKLTSNEEAALESMVHQAIRSFMDNRVSEILDSWEKNGIMDAARSVKNIVQKDDLLKEDAKEGEDKNEYVRQSLENFIWNDFLAANNILQLTVGDISFYKDAEDLQKRLAQLHAPGTRGNIYATDYNGNRVSDGKYRTVILKDFDTFISSIIDNIAEVFDRRIARAPESDKEQLRALKEHLVGKDGEYRKINVADAQGFSSPSSYRKKAFIFGKWNRHAEDVYQRLLKGDYKYDDLKVAFQPLKPFVYTHLEKNLGVPNAPIQTMHVPFQAKNSEYLLIMADAIMQGETLKSGKLSRPNLLRAIYRVMQESEEKNPTKGIDTVQFESAIKSGLQGAIDIHQFADMAGGEEAAYSYLNSHIYNTDGSYNTDTTVHEADFGDYCLQQEVPEHFKNHSQAHGSQIRMIIPSDLDYYKNPMGDKTSEDNINYYEWTEPDGTKRKVTATEFKKEYEETIAANIEDSINSLQQELHLDSLDKRERNIALSKILQREILSSPRYGVDLLQACSVDKATGEFRIPKGDPIQSKRIEQLINSIIKNRVNKQKIAGGPIVQVTNFGTSRQLHIRFNDKNGNLLKTEDEFNNDDKLKEQYKTYKQYAKENQAGIAYFEVFLPMWDDDLYNKFADENGNIDMEAVENADPELTRMVSYRIPTEDKYSMAPMKAVGFMPREAGDAIMLPYELTTIDDSDFDVDKRYVMRKELPIVRKTSKEIHDAMFARVNESYKSQHKGEELKGTQKQYYKELIDLFISDKATNNYKAGDKYGYKGKDVTSFMKYLNGIYRKAAYTTKKPTSGRLYRNNKIIDMTLAVLTNEMSADKILNPGGFDIPKRTGYMVAAYKNAANKGISWNALQSMSIDELKNLSYTQKDLAWVDTEVQFYKQNSASSSLIGVFAVNKVAHAVLESNGIYLDVDEVCNRQPFTIAGIPFDGRMQIDSKMDADGNLIGKTLGSLVSAAADGVKDPVLNLMNVNMTTANVLNAMLRLGVPFQKAAMFLSQDIISRMLNQFNQRNLTNYEPLSKIISDAITEFEKDNEISEDSNIKTEDLTEDELVEGLLSTEHKATDYKVLLAFQKMLQISEALRNPTFATRFNSISSAVGPLIIDNLIMEHKMEQFRDSNTKDSTTHFYDTDDADGVNVDIDDIFHDHPVLKQFARTVDIAKNIFSDMPAGSEGFRNILDTLPSSLQDKVYRDKKLLSSLSDFYQSYLLIASGVVNPNQLKNYVDGFPKWFNDQKFKEKYPNNALIQAIRLNVSRKTNRPFLQINITGMDTQQKEELSSAWIDLHKENPELSTRLFIYNFFRAGIGFSPKTFMALVPLYVKEHLSVTKADGSKASYVDTYRHFPEVAPKIVIDQFVRNNWNNNKLVPWKGGKSTKYSFDYGKGILEVRNPNDIADLQGTPYIKTRGKGQTYLWKLISSDKDLLRYASIKPLGDNGEYIEMNTSDIKNSLSNTTKTEEDNSASELQEQSPVEDTPVESKENVTEESKKVSEFVDLVMKQNPKLNKTEATNRFEDMKKNPKPYAKFIANVLKQKGLMLNPDEALNEFKKYC